MTSDYQEGPMKPGEIQKCANAIRAFIGPLNHHMLCNTHCDEPCDCYAKTRFEANDALEELLAEIVRRNP